LSLGLTLFLGGHPRFAGPTLVVEPLAGVWRFVMGVANPPLATLMVLATNGPAPHVCDLSGLTLVAPDVHQPFEGRLPSASDTAACRATTARRGWSRTRPRSDLAMRIVSEAGFLAAPIAQ